MSLLQGRDIVMMGREVLMRYVSTVLAVPCWSEVVFNEYF